MHEWEVTKAPFHERINIDRTQLTKRKTITVEVADNVEIEVGKVVNGSKLDPTDPRYNIDKAMGRGRKLWGAMFRYRF